MTSQQSVEMILLRQLASYLAIPIWIMDAAGNLVYYNTPAEDLLGLRFDDAGPVAAGQLAEIFEVCDLDGSPLADNEVPVVIALSKQEPAFRKLMFTAFDGESRIIDVVAMPVQGQGDVLQGAFSAFWESEA